MKTAEESRKMIDENEDRNEAIEMCKNEITRQIDWCIGKGKHSIIIVGLRWYESKKENEYNIVDEIVEWVKIYGYTTQLHHSKYSRPHTDLHISW